MALLEPTIFVVVVDLKNDLKLHQQDHTKIYFKKI